MKGKLKYIFLILGASLIVFGALIPVIFSVEKDKLSAYDSGYFDDKKIHISITSEKDYTINSAIIYINEYYGDEEIVKTIVPTNVEKMPLGDNKYVYKFELPLTEEENSFIEVKRVELNTSVGKRVADRNDSSWIISVCVITIIAGVGFAISGLVMISAYKNRKKFVENVRNEMAHDHPEINTSDMTDDQVLAKRRELLNQKENNNSFWESILGIQKKANEKVCDYCGAVNNQESKYCASCGANLKSKE